MSENVVRCSVCSDERRKFPVTTTDNVCSACFADQYLRAQQATAATPEERLKILLSNARNFQAAADVLYNELCETIGKTTTAPENK